MKDWMNNYKVKKFQAGGPMGPDAGPAPAPEAAPAPGGGAPGGDLEAMLAEYAQTRDPQLAVAICDMLVEMMMAQGGGGPEGGAPAGPEGAPAGPPMGRSGMKFRTGPVFKK